MKKIIAVLIGLLMIGTVIAYVSSDPFSKDYKRKAKTYVCYKTADGADEEPGTEDDWQCISRQGYVMYKLFDKEGFRLMIMGIGKYLKDNFRGGYDRIESPLKPDTYYQVKLNSYGAGFEADALANACGLPNEYQDCEGTPCWKCGYWGDEGFAIVGIFKTDENGKLRYSKGYRGEYPLLELPKGVYDVKVLIAENNPPWTTDVMEMEAATFVVTGRE